MEAPIDAHRTGTAGGREAQPDAIGGQMPAGGYGSDRYRRYVLFALFAIYLFNVVDRIVLSLVQDQIKAELRISDFQLGLLGGPAFAVLYALLGIPIARQAERSNRVTIVSLGIAVWSAATAACGLATSYLHLVLGRIWVGIGEAACIPPSHSLISDYFPPQRRASAFAVYSLAIPVGTIVASLGVGWMARTWGWRAPFLLLGLPGVAAAVLLKLTVREPPRPGGAGDVPSLRATLRGFARKPAFWHMAFGGAFAASVAFSLTLFTVSFLMRRHGVPVSTAATAFGAIFGVATAVGTFLGGYICDRPGARASNLLTTLPALGVLAAIPIYALGLAQASFPIAVMLLMAGGACHYLYIAPLMTVAQTLSTPRSRATASALYLLVMTLAGNLLGPPVAGALADHFLPARLAAAGLSATQCPTVQASPACAHASGLALGTALSVSLVLLAWAALHFWLAGRTLARDRVD